MKKILVCVKMVPVDFNTGIDSQFRVQRKAVGQQLNIADMSALEAALSCSLEKELTVLSMGLKSTENTLRDMLVRGADRGILLTDKKLAGADTYATARAIKAVIDKVGGFDLILCGRRAIDGETGQVPGELAAALHIPCISNVTDIQMREEAVICKRILENGTAEVEAGFPLIVSLCEYSYFLRLPSIKQMKAASERKIEIWTTEDVDLTEEQYGQKGSLTRVIKTVKLEAGLRKGLKETDADKGARKLRLMLREISI